MSGSRTDYRPRGRRGDRRGPPPPLRRRPPPGLIIFRSYEEERDWVERRRRQRFSRESKFDLPPTAEQAAADTAAMLLVNPAATDFSGIPPDQITAGLPQQTRHARRLYVGNLAESITEEIIHTEFKQAIETAYQGDTPLTEDPILSVYINHERHFCFIEFKTVEMATACMELDGLEIANVPVKIKRPNDYNAAMAPKIHPSALPRLDVSKLGIISNTVLDGPNKIFIGGLHYHLTDQQVLELLQAFGKVKAFHLVKNDSDTDTSKGYCFVEYVDPTITDIAIQGLNGMDIGGGKSLTARLAGERGSDYPDDTTHPTPPQPTTTTPGAPPPNRTIICGYDVEALVDAAMGLAVMPTAPVYKDPFGLPLTRIIAAPAKTRVLVLHNMVSDDDLATEQDRQALVEEVREECAKYGVLRNVVIPREAQGEVQPTAIRKIFLEYSSVPEAIAAEVELRGRQFGDSVVQTSYFPEQDYEAHKLY